MKTNEPELLLPDEIRLKAVMSGREWGWRKTDILTAIATARDVGLANVGGQIQFGGARVKPGKWKIIVLSPVFLLFAEGATTASIRRQSSHC